MKRASRTKFVQRQIHLNEFIAIIHIYSQFHQPRTKIKRCFFATKIEKISRRRRKTLHAFIYSYTHSSDYKMRRWLTRVENKLVIFLDGTHFTSGNSSLNVLNRVLSRNDENVNNWIKFTTVRRARKDTIIFNTHTHTHLCTHITWAFEDSARNDLLSNWHYNSYYFLFYLPFYFTFTSNMNECPSIA